MNDGNVIASSAGVGPSASKAAPHPAGCHQAAAATTPLPHFDESSVLVSWRLVCDTIHFLSATRWHISRKVSKHSRGLRDAREPNAA